MNEVFVRIDCDNVGDRIELALHRLDTNEAQRISTLIQDNIKQLCLDVKNKLSANILLIGSDDILFKSCSESFDTSILEDIKGQFLVNTGISLSIGVSTSLIGCLRNMSIAKYSGRNKIIED